MRILLLNVTDGPNYWSIKRQRLVVMQLDLEELEYQPTDEIPDFRARLEQVMPGLYEHQCSEGHPGGFLERVEDGTWMGHVIEHIALELQVMAGLDAGFGRTRGTGQEGEYHVVFDCSDAESGRLTAELAVQTAEALANNNQADVSSHAKRIRDLANDHKPGPSTSSLLNEARRRNIPTLKLEDSSTHQLGYSARQQKIEATIVSTTGNLAVETACDKKASRHLFDKMSVPIAEGTVVYDEQELRDAAEDVGFPLVLKPVSGNHGRGVTTNIRSTDVLLRAFTSVKKISNGVILERHTDGNDYRLLMIDHKLAAAAKRTPAHVVGDGTSTIEELIKEVNRDPRRGEGHNKVLTKIALEGTSKAILKRRGYTLSTVLPDGFMLHLDHAANISKGGTAEDVTDRLHPNVIATAERISKIIDLDVCGIDLMAPTLDRPLSETGGVVLEVNAAPGLRMHLSPSVGNPRNVAKPIIKMLFPDQSDGRIPTIAVTGTNGKTTTTRLLSHIMKQDGRHVGFTTTDGIYINDELMMSGDCGGPKSARFVLQDPTVDTAVLECARGGILRAGLGFDQCDVGVVTNVTSDHLGMKGIDSLEKLARVKSVVPESVHKNGFAILNADDDRVFAMKENITCNLVLFSMEADNPRIKAHTDKSGTAFVCRDGNITILEDGRTRMIAPVKDIPLSFEGRAEFMIENILAATAAAYTQGVHIDTIRRALVDFKPSPDQTPGRMNLFKLKDSDLIVDYAHNPASMAGIKDFIDHSNYQQTIGIIAAVGDRRNKDIIKLGRVAGDMFDDIIIREDHDLRGRQKGEGAELLKQGIASAGHDPSIYLIADEKEALHYAIKRAGPGSLVFMCVEDVQDMISHIREVTSPSGRPSTAEVLEHLALESEGQ